MSDQRVPSGQLTSTIYGYIRDERYSDAVAILEQQLQAFPHSRAALSLLGYCHYQAGLYEDAVRVYEQLSQRHPEVQAYSLHIAQSLYKAGLLDDVARVAARVNAPEHAAALNTLLAANALEQGDLAGCRRLLDVCRPDSPATLANAGCALYAEGRHDEALAQFKAAIAAAGARPELQYNCALCLYGMRQAGAAAQGLDALIEAGMREHPQLMVGSGAGMTAPVGGGATPRTPPPPLRSVGNSAALRASALVEAINLRAAAAWDAGDAAGARAALAALPPREEEEVDHVTLHNAAVAHLETDPAGGFRKLTHLVTTGAAGDAAGGGGVQPPEALSNLLLAYLRPAHCMPDLAADVMARYPRQCAALLSRDQTELLGAAVLGEAHPEEALRRLDALGGRQMAALRALTKRLQDARTARDAGALQRASREYDAALEACLPGLMEGAGILWRQRHYACAERVLRGAAEFVGEHPAWKLNLGHCLFLQDKFSDALEQYVALVEAAPALLGLAPSLLANTCVCYVMAGRNEEAEELMRLVEGEEEEVLAAAAAAAEAEADLDAPGGTAPARAAGCGAGGRRKLPVHLAIINLVIGTLYCAKGNLAFGIGRVVRALEPLPRHLAPDTWHYAKRCLVALAEQLAKRMVTLPDDVWEEVLALLRGVEAAGRDMAAEYVPPGSEVVAASCSHAGGAGGRAPTVAAEARMLRQVLVPLQE